MNWLRPLGLVVAGACLGVLTIVLVVGWIWKREASQLFVLEDLRAVRWAIEEHQRQVGNYPETLLEVARFYERETPPLGEDYRGNKLLYERRGSRYVLASLGEDGSVDSRGPWEIRALGRQPSICGENSADTVFSDLGEHQLCGK